MTVPPESNQVYLLGDARAPISKTTVAEPIESTPAQPADPIGDVEILIGQLEDQRACALEVSGSPQLDAIKRAELVRIDAQLYVLRELLDVWTYQAELAAASS